MSDNFMKKPCGHCPYRRDIKPFLTQSRQDQLAYHATNPYNTFPCHKTIEHDDDGEQCYSPQQKECAGFLTLMASERGEDCVPKNFTPSYDICFSDAYEMADAIDEWENN